MSAHSYGRSSATSHGHPMIAAPRGAAAVAEGQLYDSSTTTTSQSEAEGAGRGRQRRGPVGSGGGNSSFASSHYNDVYGEDSAGSQTPSSMGSRTPNARDGVVQNYFSEQPSGRNLLHVLPQGLAAHESSGGHSGAGVGPEASPSLGTYREAPSGRGLVNDQSSSEYDDGGSGHGDGGRGHSRGGGTEMSSPSQSEGSSAWNDTDAQSVPASYGQGGGGGAAAAAAAATGRRGSAFITEARSAFSTEDTKVSDEDDPSSPVVREVELYEDDLAVSEGSAAASRVQYGSEMTFGHDTAAGSSMRSLDGAQGASRGGASGRQRPGLEQVYGSSGSSVASRVIGLGSELGSNRVIPGQESWRNSPQPGENVGEIDRVLSGETSDSSVPEQRQGQEDGDFGTVWLANRAHARQYNATQDRG